MRATLDAYIAEHGSRCASTPRRATRGTPTSTGDAGQPIWRVQQVLVDAEMVNDWVAEFDIDIGASRGGQRPAMWLTRAGPLAVPRLDPDPN